MENIDGIAKGTLDEYHNFRKQEYKHLYYCYKCIRTFDSKTKTETCKFCNAAVRDITGAKFEQPFAQKYHYYCPECERSFESYSLFETCAVCSTQILHIYKWQELSTLEKIMVQAKKIIRHPKASPGMEMKSPKKGEKKERKFSFSLPKLRSKEQEELPSR